MRCLFQVGGADQRSHDVRIIGAIVMLSILGLAIVGMDWVSRVELGLLGLLILAQMDFLVGSFIPPSPQDKANGFVGIGSDSLQVCIANCIFQIIFRMTSL